MDRKIQWAGWPGRPEFIESTYYLYQATSDPFYLRVGERVLRDIQARTRTKCGFATMKNVETGEVSRIFRVDLRVKLKAFVAGRPYGKLRAL